MSLDATDEVVRMAAEGGYDMLITHHPMLFSAIKRVTDQDMNGRRLLELIRNDISYYAMHTNYDTRGMADLAARLKMCIRDSLCRHSGEDSLFKRNGNHAAGADASL